MRADAGVIGMLQYRMVLPPLRRRVEFAYGAADSGVLRAKLAHDFAFAEATCFDCGAAIGSGGRDDGAVAAAALAAAEAAAARLERGIDSGLRRVRPFAVHLHTHDRGKRVWWAHTRFGPAATQPLLTLKARARQGDEVRTGLRADERLVGEFGRIDRLRNYGTDQSFFHLDSRAAPHFLPFGREHERKRNAGGAEGMQQGSERGKRAATAAEEEEEAVRYLHEGDGLEPHCVYDTLHPTPWTAVRRSGRRGAGAAAGQEVEVEEPVRYGLGHGAEMCGFLMMYLPHDSSRRYDAGSLIAFDGELANLPGKGGDDDDVDNERGRRGGGGGVSIEPM